MCSVYLRRLLVLFVGNNHRIEIHRGSRHATTDLEKSIWLGWELSVAGRRQSIDGRPGGRFSPYPIVISGYIISLIRDVFGGYCRAAGRGKVRTRAWTRRGGCLVSLGRTLFLRSRIAYCSRRSRSNSQSRCRAQGR